MKKGELLFFDIEAFKHYWCVVVVDEQTEMRHVFEDIESLREFYKENRNRVWVGYNSRAYDSPMIRFIMLGLDPYECSQDLIVQGKKWFEFGYEITQLYKRIPFKNFDCYILNKGLKKLEGFRGSSIVESSIPWDYSDHLTREQKDEIVHYCTHDVLETRKVFYDTIDEYDAHVSLIETFQLPEEYISKSKAQIAAAILGAQKQNWYDEWEFEIPDTLKLEKYTEVLDWYLNPNNHDYTKTLDMDIAGVPHKFAWGGVHGARPRYYGHGFFLNMDVGSYYPAEMIEYGYLSRNVPEPQKFRQIRDDRLVFKKAKDPRQLPYKIVINGTYGASKDKYNPLYDPRQANSVCVSGQLLLLDLIEKLEDYCELVQSNTDGILVRLYDEKDYDKIIELSQEWSNRTRMTLEYDKIVKVFQKDVNNYIAVPEGKLYYDSGYPAWKAKGAWTKPWLKEIKVDGVKKCVPDYTEYDCVIIREALSNYFIQEIPPEETIHNCNELIKFQKIVMVSSKYTHAFQGTVRKETVVENFKKKTKVIANDDCKRLNEKHLRVFASTNENHGGIYKIHAITGGIAKANDTPVHAFIVNGNIEGVATDDFPLDKQYYIDIVNDRIKKFVSKQKVVN
jgi:hypothetical protein